MTDDDRKKLDTVVERRSRVMAAVLLAEITHAGGREEMLSRAVDVFPDLICNGLRDLLADIERGVAPKG